MNTQFTVSEIITLIANSKSDMEYFLPVQNEVTARINAKLRGEDVSLLNDNEAYIFRCCEEKAIGDARELEQTIKFAGIEPHVARKIELGAILVSSWGYDQTNVDFYAVVEMTAKMVKILPLKHKTRPDAFSSMAGHAKATKEINFRAEVMKKKIQSNNWIRIESYAHAHLWDGRERYESWYA